MIAACLWLSRLLLSYRMRQYLPQEGGSFTANPSMAASTSAPCSKGTYLRTPASIKEGQRIASAFSTISSLCTMLASVLTPALDLV